MNVIVCCKIVPEEQDIVVLPDGTLSFERAEFKIGQYDLQAIEAGVQLVEASEGKVIAFTAGTSSVDNTKLIKGILSRGPDELVVVKDDDLSEADSFATATVLAKGINKVGNYDLILCGEGSSDLYAQLVGVQLGEILGVPTINGISKITPNGDKVLVERSLDHEIEVLEIPLPAVISVTTDINVPRVPSMKDILGAGKKPVNKWQLQDLEVEGLVKHIETVSTMAPEQVERKGEIINGDDKDQVQKFLDKIRKDL